MVKLTDEQRAELEALESMPDDQIDYSDIPEMTEEQWATAKRGMFYKPDWQDITIRLDRNLVDWFEEQAETPEESAKAINVALMEHVRTQRLPQSPETVGNREHVKAVRDAIESVMATIQDWENAGQMKWREDQTRYAVIDPILRALGWNTADPKVCYPEWQSKDSKRRVDYALFPQSTTHDFASGEAVPSIVIECKSFRSELWEDDGHQLQGYVDAEPRMNEGMAVLTNGDKWLFYMLGDGPRLDAIEPCMVDLTTHTTDFIVKTFDEILGRESWSSQSTH